MTVKAPNQPQKPVSVRDSIKDAMAEHEEENKKIEKEASEKEDDETNEEAEVKEPKKESKEPKVEEPKEETTEEVVEATEETTEEKEEKTEKVSQSVKAKGTLPIPYGLTKEIRGKWGDYDQETQQFITKSLKDANDARSQAGRISPDLREVDAVLTPYRPTIQKIGVTSAQIVKRVLEYTDGLAGPNKYQMLQQIANDFDIDLTRYGKPAKQTLGANEAQTDAIDDITVDLPPETHQKLDRVLARFDEQTVSQQETQLRANQKAAEDTVHAWSGLNAATGEHEKKPYFPYVRQRMFALMKADPELYLTSDGRVDLDRVYDDACYADSQLREIMTENAKAAKAEEDRKLKEKKAKAIAAAKAKNVSLKPSAGSIGSSQPRVANNGKDRKGPVPVRESILAAIQENR